MSVRHLASLLILSLLASCGGGGGGAVLPSNPTSPKSPSNKSVQVALVIPNGTATTSHARRPAFVSPSSNGASIAVTGSLGGSGSAVVDLSNGSSACATIAGQRTCQANVTVPLDTDTFTITLYDAAPVGGAIPASAHVLGVGSVTQAIPRTFTGTVAIAVGGQISSIGLSTTFLSAPSNGSAQGIGITIAPTDFGNNPLGGSAQPYANPITVMLTESGGSGHMHLVYNGAASGATATLTKPTDTISIAYDGLGSVGYTASVALTATGAATQTLTVSPMYLVSSSSFFGAGTLTLNGTATTIPMTANEASAPGSISYTTSSTGCTNIATVTAATGTGASATFSATGSTTASASGCSITVTDNLTTAMTFNVVNTPVAGTLPLPGESIQEYTVVAAPTTPASPQAVTGGPDGRIWASDVLNGGVFAMTTSGVTTQYIFASMLIGPGGLVAGSDGYLYGADQNQVAIQKISTSGANVASTTVTYGPQAITLASDANVWFTEKSGSAAIVGSLAPGGTLTEYDIGSATGLVNPNAIGIAPGPPASGTVWFCVTSTTGAQIESVTLSTGAMSMIATTPTNCGQIAMQSDGAALWVASQTANAVYRIPTAAPFTPVTVNLTNIPYALAAGADNAMYITESSTGSYIARISNSAAPPYTPSEMLTQHCCATGIGLGSDGRMWFGENSNNLMGALTP